MRYTEYHNGVAVIKDKALLKDAMRKLAKYEDEEEIEELQDKFQKYCNNQLMCTLCNDTKMGTICDKIRDYPPNLENLRKASKVIDELTAKEERAK